MYLAYSMLHELWFCLLGDSLASQLMGLYNFVCLGDLSLEKFYYYICGCFYHICSKLEFTNKIEKAINFPIDKEIDCFHSFYKPSPLLLSSDGTFGSGSGTGSELSVVGSSFTLSLMVVSTSFVISTLILGKGDTNSTASV